MAEEFARLVCASATTISVAMTADCSDAPTGAAATENAWPMIRVCATSGGREMRVTGCPARATARAWGSAAMGLAFALKDGQVLTALFRCALTDVMAMANA